MKGTQPDDHPAVCLVRELLAVPAPPGHESALADRIGKELDRIGFAYHRDGAGNLVVSLESDAPDRPLTLLAAHMDELGLTVVGIEADGCLRVIPSGRLEVCKTGERPVTILGTKRQVPGVISLGSSHQKGRTSMLSWDDARIITGLSPAELEEAGVYIGSSLTLSVEERGPIFLGSGSDPLLAAWTFDDRMGCVTLLRLLETIRKEQIRPRRPMSIAFTTHEEGPCHGAMCLCHRLHPEVFLAVDGCPVTQAMPLTLDGRPGVWMRDVKAIYDATITDDLCRFGRAEGVEVQRAVYASAASDASAAYAVGAVERIAFLGHVRTNSHGYEVARLSVFDNVLNVLTRFVKEWE